MWIQTQRFSWNNHEVLAEEKSGMVKVSLCIDGKTYSGYSVGDDISGPNITNALADLQLVLENHANGVYLDFVKKNYGGDLIHSQNVCKRFLSENF